MLQWQQRKETCLLLVCGVCVCVCVHACVCACTCIHKTWLQPGLVIICCCLSPYFTEQCYSSSPKPNQTDDNGMERDGEVYSPHTPQELVEEVETGGSGTRGEETSASMRSPRGRQAGTEKANTYALPPELEGMAEIATEFQKAIVSGFVHKYCKQLTKTSGSQRPTSEYY